VWRSGWPAGAGDRSVTAGRTGPARGHPRPMPAHQRARRARDRIRPDDDRPHRPPRPRSLAHRRGSRRPGRPALPRRWHPQRPANSRQRPHPALEFRQGRRHGQQDKMIKRQMYGRVGFDAAEPRIRPARDHLRLPLLPAMHMAASAGLPRLAVTAARPVTATAGRYRSGPGSSRHAAPP